MELYPWHILHQSAAWIITDIQKQFENLLLDNTSGEREFLNFIANFPNIFLFKNHDDILTVSELELGPFRPDFVVVSDNRSLGLRYNLIEFQSPKDSIFLKNRNPSEGFREAERQIKEWQGWLANNRPEAERIFVTRRHDIAFTYTIVIGRRAELSFEESAMLDQYMNKGEFQVRSFDSLLDNLKGIHFRSLAHIANHEMTHPLPIEQQNALANPFVLAMTSSGWKKSIYGSPHMAHTITKNHKLILQNLISNDIQMKLFNQHLQNMDPTERGKAIEQIHWSYNL